MVTELMADRPVGTIDLSGHGRSDWRPSYSFDTWAEEVTVAAEYLFPERLALVGHSLGGALVCRAVATGLQAQTVILLEAIGSSPRKIQSAVPVIRPPQLFSSCEEAEAAVIPRKKSRPADLAAHVVYASVEPYQRQWRMRCDPRVGSVPVEDTSLAQLGTTPPNGVALGAASVFFDDLLPKIRSNQDENIHHVVVPNATHDVMMDAPGATAQFTAEFLRRHDLPIRNI